MIIDRLTIASISSPLRLRRSFSADEARSYIREKAKRVRVGTRERASREYNIIRGRPGRWVPWSVRIIKTRSAATSGFTLSPSSAFNPVPLSLTNHPTSLLLCLFFHLSCTILLTLLVFRLSRLKFRSCPPFYVFFALSIGIFLFSLLFAPTLCLAVHFASKIRRSNGPRVFVLLPRASHPQTLLVLFHWLPPPFPDPLPPSLYPLVPPRPLSMSHSWSSIVVTRFSPRRCCLRSLFRLARTVGRVRGEPTRPRRPQRGHPWYF